MADNNNLSDLRAEFDKFVQDKCDTDPEKAEELRDPDAGDAVDDEPVPQFVDSLHSVLLAPAKSGVYLSRIDIKRVAEAIDESIPIKEREKMIKALFRHTISKDFLRSAFNEFNRHINGRVLMYQELSAEFPASKHIFDGYIAKTAKVQKTFDQIVEDFEEIGVSDEPLFG